MSLFNRFKTDIGIDLGTANTLVYRKGEGIVINEPTIAAVNEKTGQTLAVGEEAKRMMGRTPAHIHVVRPLINGVISDFVMTQEIIKHYLRRVKDDALFHYVRAVVAVPTNLTEVERKSVEDAVISSGASYVYLLEEPIAAALGARLPTQEPTANIIVDIGGGTTEIAIMSMGGVVVSRSLKVAGDKCNEEIIRFVRDEFNLLIGEPTAENIKITIGSALASTEKLDMAISGRDLSSGLPRETVVRDTQVRAVLSPLVKQIIESIRDIIEQTPPELAGDILRHGIYFSGGGSLLRGLVELVEKELNVKTVLVDDPLTCVVRGTGIAAENIEAHKHMFSYSVKPIIIQ
jgi:rod shape-determining protein MreB